MKRFLTVLLPLILIAPSGKAFAQLGQNCGEHPDLLRDRSGKIVWFTPEKLKERATKQVEPETPSMMEGFHFQGDVSFKVLVDKNGEVACIWERIGNPMFAKAANEALQYWTFKPMTVNGKPVEFVGTMKFHMSAR